MSQAATQMTSTAAPPMRIRLRFFDQNEPSSPDVLGGGEDGVLFVNAGCAVAPAPLGPRSGIFALRSALDGVIGMHPSWLDQVISHRVTDKVGGRRQSGLSHGGAPVGIDSLDGKIEVLYYLLVAETLGHELDDFALAR